MDIVVAVMHIAVVVTGIVAVAMDTAGTAAVVAVVRVPPDYPPK
jgi:hypothetical protein